MYRQRFDLNTKLLHYDSESVCDIADSSTKFSFMYLKKYIEKN